ncbi:hypothetical protein D3C71_1381060 [compost metagenome]
MDRHAVQGPTWQDSTSTRQKGCSMERKSVVLEDLLDDVAPTTNTTTELGIVITIAVVIL